MTQCPFLSNIPASDYLPTFKSFLYDCWRSFCFTLPNSKLHFINSPKSPLSDPYKNSWWEIAVTCLCISHMYLPYMFLPCVPQQGPFCKIPFTAHHVLLASPQLTAVRTNTFSPYVLPFPYSAPCLCPCWTALFLPQQSDFLSMRGTCASFELTVLLYPFPLPQLCCPLPCSCSLCLPTSHMILNIWHIPTLISS